MSGGIGSAIGSILDPLRIFRGPKMPKQPGVPEPPPDPAEMPDPEDEQLKKRKQQAAVRKRTSGLQSTILSDSMETLG